MSKDPFFEPMSGIKLPSDSRSLAESVKLLRATMFAGRRDSTRAMAQALGKSERTIRRYAAGEVKKPPAAVMDKVRDEFRTNRDLRQAAVAAAPRRAGRGTVQVTVTGQGGPVIGDSDHSGRPRPPITLSLTPDQYDKLRQAFVDGGASGALNQLNQHGDQYFDNFQWSKVDSFQVR